MISRIAITLLAAFALISQTMAAPSGQQTQQGKESAISKYSYVIVLNRDTTFEMTDSLFYSISRKVIFPVNKYTIPKNSSFRREVEREIMPYMNDRYHTLDKIIVRGAASPEGPRRWNETLSRRRVQALVDLISEHTSEELKVSHGADASSAGSASSGLTPKIQNVAEDYIYLLLLMKERNDKDYPIVADIVNKWIDTDEAKLKEELRRYDHSKLWYRLLREYFPELRASRVVLLFKKYYDIPMKEIEPQPTMVMTEAQAPFVKEPTAVVALRQPRRELLSVKTNLLHDFAYMPGYDRWCPIPNIAVEYYPLKGHFTFGASVDFPWWQNYDDHKYFQIRNYQLETRYYFKSGDIRECGHGNGAAFKGWYVQAYGQLGLYNICFDADRGWEGEAAGGGLGFGYVMPFSKSSRWRLEFGAQFGFLWTKYDPYQWLCPVDGYTGGQKYYYKWTGKPEDFTERQHRFTWIGPTRLNITLSYDLLYRKRTKSGASLRSWEMKY